MRDSFVFYRSFFETFKKIPAEDRLELFEAVCEYALNDNVSDDLSIVSDAIFTLLKPQLDANTRKYENGLKGGRPKAEKKPNQNQTETKTKPNNNQAITKPKPNDNVNDNDNVNVNVNDNVNDNENVSVPDESLSLSSSIISYLNEKTGSSYQPDESNEQRITDLIGVGYTAEDLRAVIDRKCSDWLMDPKMRQYLRPSTLFGKKFSEYLSAPAPVEAEEEQKRTEELESLYKKQNEIQSKLVGVMAAISLETDPKRLQEQYERQSIYQDQLDAVNRRLEAM